MKLSQLACLATLCFAGSTALAQSPPLGPIPASIAQVGYCDCGYAGCGCEVASPGCDGSCDGACDGGCGGTGIFDNAACGGCNLGEPFAVFGHCGSFKMGGWAQLGYHNANLLFQPAPSKQMFNNRKNDYQLHQAWLFAEKEIDTENGGGIGGRIDYFYGTDGPNSQAFGIFNSNHWDNDWDNPARFPNDTGYGNAIPQAYFEAGYGAFRVKAGKFFSMAGYERVAAPANFFYSHTYSFTMSQPLTYTGVLATYCMNEDVTLFGGYVLGWDTGFANNGDSYVGGARVKLTEDIIVTSTTVAGRLNDKFLPIVPFLGITAERGWMHSTTAEIALTDRLEYVFQTDWLDTEGSAPLKLPLRETYGISQYLIHSINDCLALGARFEWWNNDRDSVFYQTGEANLYDLTLGANISPHANVRIRPEIRWDWSNVPGVLEDNDNRQTTFGIDSIFIY